MKRLARKLYNLAWFGLWSDCRHDWQPILGVSSAEWWCPHCNAQR